MPMSSSCTITGVTHGRADTNRDVTESNAADGDFSAVDAPGLAQPGSIGRLQPLLDRDVMELCTCTHNAETAKSRRVETRVKRT